MVNNLLNTNDDLSKYSSNYSDIISSAKSPEALTTLFEIAYNSLNVWDPASLIELFGRINYSFNSHFNEDQTDRILIISTKIFPYIQNDELKKEHLLFFEDYLNVDRVFDYLIWAKKAGNRLYEEKALEFIRKKSGLTFDFNDHLKINISYFIKLPFDDIIAIISDLAIIYEDNIEIKFNRKFCPFFEQLTEIHGKYFRYLELIHLDESSIEKILTHCPNVIELFINSRHLNGSCFDGLSNLKNLKILNAIVKKLKYLPFQLNELASLEILDLSGSKNLITIPPINHLKNLKQLNLSYCSSLKELPCLTELSNLTELSVNGTNIEKFPILNLKNLECLDLSYCKLIEFPDLKQLKNLKEVFFGNECHFKDSEVIDAFTLIWNHDTEFALTLFNSFYLALKDKNEQFFRNLLLSKISSDIKLFSIYVITRSNTQENVINLLDLNNYSKAFYTPFSKLQISLEDPDLTPFETEAMTIMKAKNWSIPLDLWNIINKKDFRTKKYSFLFLSSFLANCLLENITDKEFEFFIHSGFMKNFLNYTEPKMRLKFIRPAIEFVKNKEVNEFGLQLLEKKPPPHSFLALLFLSTLFGEGVSKETCLKQFKSVSSNLFKQGENLRLYLTTLELIFSELKIEDKEYVLSTLDFCNFSTLRSIQTLKNMGKISLLNKENLEKSTVSNLVGKTLEDIIHLENVNNVAEQYSKYFSNSRLPHYILMYAANFPADSETSKSLGIGVSAILRDEYPHIRYDMAKSKHLTAIFSSRPELLEIWKKGETALFGDTNKYKDCIIADTDDYQDLFLCGTEVGSCLDIQNVNGYTDNNRCLLAYVFDGKNRLIVIKDKDGKIIARQIMRVLWNGLEPVLFTEAVYPKLIDEKLKRAMVNFAIIRAQKLGLTLLTTDPSKPPYELPIYSLSSSNFIEFEYTDSGKTGETNGKFTIKNSNILSKI